MFYGYGGYGPQNIVFGSLLGAGVLYYVISLIAFLFTSVEERRLELAGETVLDSLRTMGLTVKQTATLTNMKLYQNGVFLFGRKRRAVVIPLDRIDSVQIASGRNYLWLALSIATVISLLYQQGSREASTVTEMLVLTVIFFGLFWISGSRRIVVRSSKATIVVEASTLNSSLMGAPVLDSRIFGFANRIQSLIVHPRERELTIGFSNGTGRTAASGSTSAASALNECASCGVALASGSRFCEGCGIPVS